VDREEIVGKQVGGRQLAIVEGVEVAVAKAASNKRLATSCL